MPPIKLHTNSPINAAKAEGITPKTAAAPSNDEDSSNSGTGQPQQVGGGIQNQINAPLHGPPPTRTTTSTDSDNNHQNNPPPPQPGAVPYPQPTAMAAPGSYATPAAPSPTEPARLPSGGQDTHPTTTGQHPPPPQMGMSLMESNAPHAYRGTSTATAPSMSSSTSTAAPSSGIGGSSTGGSRQVGYGTTGSYGGGYAGYSPPAAGGYQQQGGGNVNATGGYRDNTGDGDEEGVWNSAVKWAQAAGEKLSAAESEVWRRINKE